MKKIFVAGHRGMVGSAICRQLKKQSDVEIIMRSRDELDLCNQSSVHQFIQAEKPDEIILAAAKVGGIHANNNYPVDFLYENLMLQANVIHAAHEVNVERVLFLGSSCIYPKLAEQPILEASLLTGELEPTNEWYAIAKIAGIKMVQAYRKQFGRDWISAMPTNLYGPGDSYDLQNSHVLPALIRKFHEAKERGDTEVVVWGSGSPLREFMHVDDLADALVFLLKYYSGYDHINVGSGEEVTIKELAEIIGKIVEFKGRFVWDKSKPDGTPRKLMDSTRLYEMGWENVLSLQQGIQTTYAAYCQSN